MNPRLPLTVSRSLWDEVAEQVRPEFADSYLSGAVETATTLIPHTVTAYKRLKESRHAMSVFVTRGLKLVEPLPFGHPSRPDSLTATAA